MKQPLLEVKSLTKEYQTKRSLLRTTTVRAVSEVSFSINAGETFGLVGESGSGKTTISRCLVSLERYQSGDIFFHGQNIKEADKQQRKSWHKDVQMIFQDPLSSLDPKQTISSMFSELLIIHQRGQNKSYTQQLMIKHLAAVGLKQEHLERYPHQFSGGQLQRIAIARTLILEPELIICDEPVSALDVSIQAQILNLLKQLKQDHQLAMLFISHDISVIHYLADRIGVLYRGRLVEVGTRGELFDHPKHPYTQLLLGNQEVIDGSPIVNHAAANDQCAYYPFCPNATGRCKNTGLVRKQISDSHYVMCHHSN